MEKNAWENLRTGVSPRDSLLVLLRLFKRLTYSVRIRDDLILLRIFSIFGRISLRSRALKTLASKVENMALYFFSDSDAYFLCEWTHAKFRSYIFHSTSYFIDFTLNIHNILFCYTFSSFGLSLVSMGWNFLGFFCVKILLRFSRFS